MLGIGRTKQQFSEFPRGRRSRDKLERWKRFVERPASRLYHEYPRLCSGVFRVEWANFLCRERSHDFQQCEHGRSGAHRSSCCSSGVAIVDHSSSNWANRHIVCRDECPKHFRGNRLFRNCNILHCQRANCGHGIHVHGDSDECDRFWFGVHAVFGGDAWGGSGETDGCVGCSW